MTDKRFDSTPKKKTTVRKHKRKLKGGRFTIVSEHLREFGAGHKKWGGGWTTKTNNRRLEETYDGELVDLIVQPQDRLFALLGEIEYDTPFAGNVEGRIIEQNDDWSVMEIKVIDLEEETTLRDIHDMKFKLEFGIDETFGNVSYLSDKFDHRMDTMTVHIAVENAWSTSTERRKKQNMDKLMLRYERWHKL